MGNNKMSSQESPFFARDDLSLRLMFESAAIMLLVEPETGIILEANPAAVQFYGYPRSKLCGMSIDEINALPAEQVALERQKAKNEGRINLVLPHRLANGEERIVEEISSIFVWQQKPVTFTIIHDITECLKSPTYSLNLDLREKVRQHEILLDDLRTNKIELEMQNQELRRTQGELLAARARYFDLYDLAPVGYCTISVDDLILETNLTAASLLDATRGAMVNTPFHRFVHPQYQPAYFLYRRQLFETGQPRTLDIKMQRQDGSHFWGHLEAIVTKEPLAYLKQDSAEPVAALVVISDISARKLAEENLYDLQWRLEMVIEATRAGTWVWNIQTGETIFNEIWAQICGYTLAELMPTTITTWELLANPDDLKQSSALLERHFAGELPYYDCELRMKHKDGHWVWVHDRGCVITYTAGGKPLMMFGTHTDITDRKQAEAALRVAYDELEARVLERTADLQKLNAALEKASKAKDEFMAIMSHELRTPLTGILGLSQVLQTNSLGEINPKQTTAIRNIEKSGLHLLDLINQMLDYSRLEAGGLVLQLTPCSLQGICQASIQKLNAQAIIKKQHLSFHVSPENIILHADERRLQQVIVNLLNNAIKFTPVGGDIELSVTGQPDSQRVVITVRDTGIGIKPEDLPRLFQPFVQLDMGLSRQYPGTGLGLAIVKQIVELHAGSVSVESEFGQGSRFIVSLPWQV